MSPGEFRDSVVLPNLRELQVNTGNVRLAFNAAAAVDALAAQIFHWCQANTPGTVAGLKDDTEYRERLAKQHPYFGLLRDIAKTQKHAKLTRTRGNPAVARADQIMSRNVVYSEEVCPGQTWARAQVVVAVTRSGRIEIVEAVVELALDVLDDEMARYGIARLPSE